MTTNRPNVKSSSNPTASRRRRPDKGAATADAVDGHERAKDFLTPAEVDRLIKATRDSRYSLRDHVLIRMMYRHGLRVSEAIALRVGDVNLAEHRLHFRRLKGGLSVPHPIDGESMRALKRYLAHRTGDSPWLFVSERGGQMTRQAVNYIVGQAGERAGLGHVHPHMLRHSCGYALADLGTDFRVLQDYLGHRNPRHTAHYTRTNPARFVKVWEPRR